MDERKSMVAVRLFKRPLPMPNSLPSATAGPPVPGSFRTSLQEKLAQVVVKSLTLLDWFRTKPKLWFVILLTVVSSVVPLPDATFSLPWALSAAAMNYLLVGAAFPSISKETIGICGKAIAVSVIGAVVIAPGQWWCISKFLLPTVFRCNQELLCVGFICIGCLPTSHIAAVLATRAAQGNEPLTECLTTICSLLCACTSPLLVHFFLYESASWIPRASLTWTVGYAAAANIAFLFGVLLQRGFASYTQKKHRAQGGSAQEVTLADASGSQVSVFSAGRNSLDEFPGTVCTDPCEVSVQRWRQWALRRNADLALVAVYILFSSFTRLRREPAGASTAVSANSRFGSPAGSLSVAMSSRAANGIMTSPEVRSLPSAGSAFLPGPLQKPFLSGKATFALVVLEGVALTLTIAVVWLYAGRVTINPEERISVALSGSFKSDVTMVAVFLVVFAEKESARIALAPVSVFALVQAVAEALTISLLRRWRSSVNCRPGTTLLPQRFSHSTRKSLTPSV